MPVSESQIQTKIKNHLIKNGWHVIKIIQCSENGIPDLLALKNGRAVFIEVKRPGGKIAPLQEYRIEKLIQNGFTAFIAKSTEDVIEKLRL